MCKLCTHFFVKLLHKDIVQLELQNSNSAHISTSGKLALHIQQTNHQSSGLKLIGLLQTTQTIQQSNSLLFFQLLNILNQWELDESINLIGFMSTSLYIDIAFHSLFTLFNFHVAKYPLIKLHNANTLKLELNESTTHLKHQ